MNSNEARVQVDIGVQVNPRQEEELTHSPGPPYWHYVLGAVIALEALASVLLLRH